MSWLQDYLDCCDLAESPKDYFYWAMLSVISSVIGKKIWLNRGGLYVLYPGIYVFLISKRSGLRKGIPINVAKKLAHGFGGIRVIDGQNSIQGVMKELSLVRTVNGHIIKDAQGFLISGEFASFLLSDGIGYSLTTLTDLYDAQYHEQGFKKRLVSQDELELKNLCLTALFASNETHFFDSVPSNAIRGGFLARTFIIYEEKRNTINSLSGLIKPVPRRVPYKEIISHLQQISKLEGEIVPSPEAAVMWDDWYYKFTEEKHEEEDETGTSERLGDNIWKAAILLSLAHSPELIIYKDQMKEAIEKTLETYVSVKRLLLSGSGGKEIKQITMRTTIAILIEMEPVGYECDRKQILRRGAGVFGVYDLDECIEHLLQAGMIKIDKRGPNVYYKLQEIVINRYKNGEGI